MNDNIQKSLMMGASIMVTIGIISIGLMIFSQGSNLVKESSNNMVDLTQELNTNRYMAYEDSIVSGAEVVNVINVLANENLEVIVKGKGTGSYTYTYTNNYGTDDNDDTIDFTTTYKGKLNFDTNGNVASITFTEM